MAVPQAGRSQAELEARAAATHRDTKAANTWRAWERQYGEAAVSPSIEGKPALQITDELARSNDAAAARAHDPREIALDRASAVFWRGLHAQLAAGQPLTVAFPKREMLTPVPGMKGTPQDTAAQPTAADCAQLARRVRFCEAQTAQLAHENATGLYGDRSFPLLMQQLPPLAGDAARLLRRPLIEKKIANSCLTRTLGQASQAVGSMTGTLNVNAPERARYFSPAETAKRLGVSAKALRLYETRGLVTPLRTAAGWRAYGPEQLARLHQVIALKRMGLSLAQVSALLSGQARRLDAVLAAQEQVLAGESTRVSEALGLVRAARVRLAQGEALSIDDLATLTKETTMTAKPTPEEMKKLFDPHVAKHFSPEEIAEAAQRKFDPACTQQAWDSLIAEAKALMAKGEEPTSPAARDLAKRWRAMVAKFTQGNPDMERRLKAVWNDAMADPKSAPQLPLNPEIFAFVAKAASAADKSKQ